METVAVPVAFRHCLGLNSKTRPARPQAANHAAAEPKKQRG